MTALRPHAGVRGTRPDGRGEHAYLGVSLSVLTPDLVERLDVAAESGAVVATIDLGSPADDAGVRPGDVIVEIGERRVEQIEDVLAALRPRDPNETVELDVLPDGERRPIEVRLGERPGRIAPI